MYMLSYTVVVFNARSRGTMMSARKYTLSVLPMDILVTYASLVPRPLQGVEDGLVSTVHACAGPSGSPDNTVYYT